MCLILLYLFWVHVHVGGVGVVWCSRILFVCFLSKVLYSYTFKKTFPKESSTTKLEVD